MGEYIPTVINSEDTNPPYKGSSGSFPNSFVITNARSPVEDGFTEQPTADEFQSNPKESVRYFDVKIVSPVVDQTRAIGDRKFPINSYRWHLNSGNLETDIGVERVLTPNRDNVVPMIKMYEFAPFEVLSKLATLARTFRDIIKAGQSLQTAIQSMIEKADQYDGVSSEQRRSTLDKLFKGNSVESVKENVLNASDEWWNILVGEYYAYYELPYQGTYYANVDGAAGWSINDENFLSDLTKIIDSFISRNKSSMPMWTNQNSLKTAGYPSISTTFVLFNDNYASLQKNMRFLHNVIPGMMWSQVNLFALSPNVYTVELPGSMYLQFCTMKTEVTQIGNRRRLSFGMKQQLGEYLGIDRFNSGLLSRDALIPDYFKVTVSIDSLVPYNFNNYVSYLIRGTNENIKIGTVVNPTNKLFGV